MCAVALIKLAERTCFSAIRGRQRMHREKKALRVSTRECFGYLRAPWRTASASAISKWELVRDLSSDYLSLVQYKQIGQTCWMRRRLGSSGIYRRRHEPVAPFELEEAGIHAEISGRAKHNLFHSGRQDARKGSTFSQVYDAASVRVLCRQSVILYLAGHRSISLWRHIPMNSMTHRQSPRKRLPLPSYAVVGPVAKVLEVADFRFKPRRCTRKRRLGVCAQLALQGYRFAKSVSVELRSMKDKIA